jgi:hypothetical protein
MLGNPPWIAFRHMSAGLQTPYKALARHEAVYVGGKLATQNDLCALFAVRSAGLYLPADGRLAFILPMAALTRGQFAPFRSGAFPALCIAWDEAWTLDDSVQPLFPVPACVLFGRRQGVARPVPDRVRAYAGALPGRDLSEAEADAHLTVTEQAPALAVACFSGGSPYRTAFKQGAILVPRLLCLVERRPGDRPRVISRRSPQEKPPWKALPALEHRVEADFLRPVLLGESILPFRVWRAFEAVIPVEASGRTLDAAAAGQRGLDGLQGWLGQAEAVWQAHQASALSFVQQIDYYGKLTAQFPLAPLRLVFAASGTQPAACVVRGGSSVVEHGLYWTAPASEAEAHYLAAVLNSETTRRRAERHQARGQFGARHFDKVAFTLPIPRFDGADAVHRGLAAAAAQAEAVAAALALAPGVKFQRARALVRAALSDAGLLPLIDELVGRLLGLP